MLDNAPAEAPGTENTIIRIGTPGGTLQAEAWADPLRPGIQVTVDGELAALVEHANGKVIVRIYGRDSDEVLSSWDFGEGMFV